MSSSDLTEEVALHLHDQLSSFFEWLTSDLALDLAYAIGDTFGEQFESWQNAHQTSSTNAKVESF